MTQKEMYTHIAEALANDPEVVEFCQKKLEQLNRPRKPKVNETTIAIGEKVMEYLQRAEEPMTNKELYTWYNENVATTDEDTVSAQKMAAVMRHLVGEEKVRKIVGDKPSDPTRYEMNC